MSYPIKWECEALCKNGENCKYHYQFREDIDHKKFKAIFGYDDDGNFACLTHKPERPKRELMQTQKGRNEG